MTIGNYDGLTGGSACREEVLEREDVRVGDVADIGEVEEVVSCAD